MGDRVLLCIIGYFLNWGILKLIFLHSIQLLFLFIYSYNLFQLEFGTYSKDSIYSLFHKVLFLRLIDISIVLKFGSSIDQPKIKFKSP